MKINHPILTLFLLFISPFYLNAQQIQKGLTSINGAAHFNHRNYKDFSANQFAVEPNYGRFLNNHLMLGAEAKFSFEKYNSYPYIFEQDHSIYAQYYFNPKNKWKILTELSFDITSVKTNTNSFYVSTFNSLGISGGLGVNRFINQEIAFQGKLIYSRNPELLKGFRYHDHYSNSLRLTFGFTNFTNFNRDSTTTYNLIKKGRRVINGNIDVVGGEDDTKIASNIDYGYFVSKRIMIGVSAYTNFFVPSPTDRGIDIYLFPYIQYYHKIHKKIYGHIKSYAGILDSRYLNHPLAWGINGGLDYFLSTYTFIEVNLVDYKRSFLDQQQYYTDLSRYDFSYGPQIRMRYFLR